MTAEGNSDVGQNREEIKQDDQRLGMIYVVKTKTEDGGSPTPEDNDGSDAFSRYSNPSVRRRLLGLDQNEGAGANNTAVRRKTRLSTELHCSVFYEELMMLIDELQE